MRDDQPKETKPYRTYKAGRGRRKAVDDELAGARPPRPAGPSGNGRGRQKAYRTYGAASRDGGGPGARPGAAPMRRRRFRWWHVPVALLAVVAVAGVVLTILAWPGYKKFDRAVDKANARVDERTRAQLTPDDGWIWRNGTTLLLLGVDSKAGEPARSDTILLMRFDPKTRTINQLSIPRDTRVQLPNGSYDKINTAMFWNGPPGVVKAVKQLVGVGVNHVMIVDFKGFPRLVNAVGGVDLYVPKTVSTVAGSNARPVVFKRGMHHFNGKYAMLYVRLRYADDDFHRATRQQQFVQALQKKVAQPSNITRLPEIGKRFMSGVATDLTTRQILELSYLKWRSRGGKKMVLVGEPAWVNGVAYVLPPADEELRETVRKFLGK